MTAPASPWPISAEQAAVEPVDSANVRVRLVEEADLPSMLAVHADDAVTRFLPYTTWQTLADARSWYERALQRHEEGSALQFVIVAKASEQVVGTCMLFKFEPASARAELGYALGRRYWGQGHMKEALTAFIGHAFAAWGLRRIEADVDPRNAASARLLERLGFQREGLLRQRWVTKGEVRDAFLYGLLRGEWQAGPRLTAPPT